MSDNNILSTVKEKPIIIALLSVIVILGIFAVMEAAAPTDIKPSALAGFREKTDSSEGLSEGNPEVVVTNYEECKREGGITSVEGVCTFGKKTYKQKVDADSNEAQVVQEQEYVRDNPESSDSQDIISYSNPSFPNLLFPYDSSWSLSEFDERSQGAGLYILEFTRNSELLRIEINSLPRSGAAISCFQGDSANVLEEIRGVENQIQDVSAEGNSFYQPTKIYKIGNPSQEFSHLYTGLEEFTAQDKESLAAGDPFYQNCTDSAEYKFSPVLTKVEGSEMSVVADLDFYLNTDNQETVSEVDSLISRMQF
jgi:hypothetical protein